MIHSAPADLELVRAALFWMQLRPAMHRPYTDNKIVCSVSRKWSSVAVLISSAKSRSFRSVAALEAIARASEEKVPNVVLYNYPSFSGAFSALFARLFHARLSLPCLISSFSSVEPLRIEDLYVEGLERFYLLELLAPKGFAARLVERSSCEVIGFDHRKSVLPIIQSSQDLPRNVTFNFDLQKSSSTAVYEYFNTKLVNRKLPNVEDAGLLNLADKVRVETVLMYIEDADLRKWSLHDIRAFGIGLAEWRSKLNCVTNPFMYEQLLEINSADMIAKGNSYTLIRNIAAKKLLKKVFRVRLGRVFYGECRGIRANGYSGLSDEIGKQLSIKSGLVGLRPIGAVIYMQGNNLKMSLRSLDPAVDTSEVAKAYGGGGSPASSSFIIRMDQYNQWLSAN